MEGGERSIMSTAENKKVIQDAFVAWSRGEGSAFFNILADDGAGP